VFGFLKSRLYFDEHAMIVTDEVPTKDNENLTQNNKKVADDGKISLSILRFHNL
jgi:leucyl-tRNA synthetase